MESTPSSVVARLLFRGLVTSISSFCLLIPPAKCATISNETFTGSIIAVGERPPGLFYADEYFAQTFTMPATNYRVARVHFLANNNAVSESFNAIGPVTIRMLLTTIRRDDAGVHPDLVLYESEPIVVPHDLNSGWTGIDVDVPEVALQPLVQYAFVLDAARHLDLTDQVHAYMQIASAYGYNGGQFLSSRVRWDENGGYIGTREEHFAQTWHGFAESRNVDMFFRITLIPEPSMAVLAAIAIVASWVAANRYRRLRQSGREIVLMSRK